MDLKEDGTFSRPGPWVRFKFASKHPLIQRIETCIDGLIPVGQLLNKKKPAMIRRIEYKGLALPDWEVPCSNGNDCNRRKSFSQDPSLQFPCLSSAYSRLLFRPYWNTFAKTTIGDNSERGYNHIRE